MYMSSITETEKELRDAVGEVEISNYSVAFYHRVPAAL